MTDRPASATTLARFREEIVYIQFAVFPGIERADSLVNLRPQPTQLFDVRKQPLPDLLLIGIRKACNFGKCAFKGFDHVVV